MAGKSANNQVSAPLVADGLIEQGVGIEMRQGVLHSNLYGEPQLAPSMLTLEVPSSVSTVFDSGGATGRPTVEGAPALSSLSDASSTESGRDRPFPAAGRPRRGGVRHTALQMPMKRERSTSVEFAPTASVGLASDQPSAKRASPAGVPAKTVTKTKRAKSKSTARSMRHIVGTEAQPRRLPVSTSKRGKAKSAGLSTAPDMTPPKQKSAIEPAHRRSVKKKTSKTTGSQALSAVGKKTIPQKLETYWRALPPNVETSFAALLDDVVSEDNGNFGFDVALELLSGHFGKLEGDFRGRSSAKGMTDDQVDSHYRLAELKAELEMMQLRCHDWSEQVERERAGRIAIENALNNEKRVAIEELTAHTKREIEQSRHETEELAQRLSDTEKSLLAHRTSTFWRMTAPLRGAVTLIRKSGRAVSRRLITPKNRRLVDAKTSDRAALQTIGSNLNMKGAVTLPNRIRIVAIGDGPIPSIFLGLNIPLSDIAIRFGGEFSLHYENDLPIESILRSADVVFVKRACSDAVVKVVRFLREIEIPIVYMLDDDFNEIPADSPLGRRHREMNGPANIQRLCELADVTVTWTNSLADKLRPCARKLMVFNGPSNIEMFDEMPPPPRRSDGRIRIGYAGGSTHAPDLELIRPAVLGLLERHSNVDFESIGIEISWLKGNVRYRHFEGAPILSDYYRIVASRCWDLAVAPLADTSFNRAKSDNKLREYAAAGYPAVYSRVRAFEESVRDGENGILVDNTTEAWTAGLEKLISNRGLRERIVTGSEADARGRYSRVSVHRQYEDLIAQTTRPHRVLAVGPQNLATFAIDIDGPFKILRRKGVAHLRTKEVPQVTADDLRWATTVVIVRAFEPNARALARAAKRVGCKVVYSWDDNWVAFPRDQSALSKHIYDSANRESLFDVLREVDMIKATTPEIYEESCRHNQCVVSHPYGFDFDLTQHRPPSFRRDGRIRLGYFGTPGRDSQFDFVIEAIKRVQQRYGNLDLEFFGFNPIRGAELERVINLPYADGYDSSIRTLLERHWDIALAPLADTTFNRSKLPTKYRDYAAVGAAGIYTWIPPYEAVVTNFRTGILADNSVDAWAEAITRLVEDGELRESIAREAFEHVRGSFSAEFAAKNWHDILDRLRGS
jgi:glycosyltransferase involved in cell wall biosynthesis